MGENIVKPTRTSKKKVRTGCITCKIRRIKCDESKPACLRCTRTGRKCDGYTSSPAPTAGPVVPAKPGKMASKEGRAQEFFYQKTVPELSGFFGKSFWNTVLQFSLTEPAIRHATIALATLHEEHSSPMTANMQPRDNLKFAIQSYNRSIGTVLKRASDPTSMPLVTLASIVFTCFECLLGDPKAAAAHVASGISLLKMWREKSGQPMSSWGQNYRSFELSFVETHLAPVLCTLSLCVAEFGSPVDLYLNPVDFNSCPIFGEPFRELSESRVGLIDIITAAVRLGQEDAPVFEISVKAAGLSTALECWKMRFDDLVQRRGPSWSDQDQGAADLVRVMWQSTAVGLSVGLASNETAWDSHKSAYEEIIRLVESLIARHQDAQASATFHFEMGIISPLHLVAWKCRWPQLRRKGLALLLASSRRECLYDAFLYHAVFSRIMAIEEGHLESPVGEMLSLADLPPEQARIHHFFCEPALTATENVYSLTVFSKPNWPEAMWCSRTEYIDAPGGARPSSLSPTSPLSRLPVVNLFRTGPVSKELLQQREPQLVV
ncbi:hypothetical protein BHE90_000285 [Fusarium euwallaceae]|uniref:Zn(2)-C6 fungal-type domain-containing protein n=2 Tax=Fusarium solani species complex TaxID=232080 RepID=A0A3M2SPL4_9HYPO|nr:hypothetical protein CDV36_000846 [Fusarium kuroshium]RTE85186.1 hypothetical protein BHE90_000285 [Fusarium euwallaceae]